MTQICGGSRGNGVHRRAAAAAKAAAAALAFAAGAAAAAPASDAPKRIQDNSFLLEAAWTSYESVQPGGSKVRGETAFLNPGMRFAVNFRSGLQVVPGLAFPIGIGPSRGESGVLTYLSLEHPLF